MLAIYSVLAGALVAGLPIFSIGIIFTALASEGAVGLALIVKNSRASGAEMTKAGF